MERIKVSDDFYLDEFIHPDIYKAFGDYSRRYIDSNLIQIAQLFRELVGKPVTINNWLTGGSFKNSGLRNPYNNPHAKFSVHPFGRAIDVKVSGMAGVEMYEIVRDNLEDFMLLGLTTVEDTRYTSTWLHLSTEWTNQKELRIVKP